jgi:iron complex transport system substrate-binding protein
MNLFLNLLDRSHSCNRVVAGFVLVVGLFNAVANASDSERVISTDAGSTHILIALGVTNELVAVDVTSQVPSSLKVKRLGYHRTLSAEGVLSLNPSLIIGSEHMGPPKTVESIKKAGVALVQLPVAHNEQLLKHNIETIGTLLGRTDQIKKLLDNIDQSMVRVRQGKMLANTPVLFLLQMDGRSLRMAGKGTTGNDVITLLGGKNIGSHNGYQAISAESLLVLEPAVILVAGREKGQSSVNLLLENYPLLEYTMAGKSGNIIAIDGNSIVAGISLAAIDGLVKITSQLR